ncbi:unnamed protein product [Sphagnum balticum]
MYVTSEQIKEFEQKVMDNTLHLLGQDMKKKKRRHLPMAGRTEGFDQFNELKPLVNLKNSLAKGGFKEAAYRARSVGGGWTIFSYVRYGDGWIRVSMNAVEDMADTTTSSCKTKEQLEVAVEWIRSNLGQLPNAALDYDYNMKQAKLMPLYRAMAERGSDLVQGDKYVKTENRPPCDGRCTHASGPHCDCMCHGANHGTGKMVTTVVVGGKVKAIDFSEEDLLRAYKYRKLRDYALQMCDDINASYYTRRELDKIIDFEGRFSLNKKLDIDTQDFLTRLNETRRMKRKSTIGGVYYGVDGEFYVHGEGFAGQYDEESVVDYNRPPSTQPGLWCQWRPSDDGMHIQWDGGEKFYNYVEWIKSYKRSIYKMVSTTENPTEGMFEFQSLGNQVVDAFRNAGNEGTNMKYSVNVRIKNPGIAKYLIDARDFDNFMDAFQSASNMAKELDNDHFVEIVDNDFNEKVVNYGIQRLAHLVQTKNDLNRKRRRFYALLYPRHKRELMSGHYIREDMHFAYSKMEAAAGYRKAKEDMKAMTAEMKEARKELNAKFIWSDHGAISAIVCGDHRYSPEEIARLAELYNADAILLGD